MGWKRFTSWLEVMKRQNAPPELDPGSWVGTENDPWWVNERKKRDESRGQ